MSLQPGSILNQRYRIDKQLGKGGMGAVFLAYDQTLDIRVAVKENLSLNPESEKQFRREAKLLAGLRHPNLPRVTDHFILDGRQYLVMDFIEGEDLHQRAMRQPPTVQEVLTWADAVSSALTFLHNRPQPIIHRDIKPANIKLQPDGTLILVDFGLAKQYDQAVTSTGARGLTPGFSPPEQYGSQRTDPRSDQYSFAATLYALLTGQKPVDSIDRMLNKEQLQPIHTLNPAVPEVTSTVIQRAMALDQDDRFPDIASFHAALRGYLQAETVRVEPKTQVVPRPRLYGLLIGGGALGLVLVLGLLVVFLRNVLPALGEKASPTTSEPIAVALEASATLSPTSASTPTTPPASPTSTLEPTTPPTPTATSHPTQIPIGGGGLIAFISDRSEGIQQIWTMKPDGSDPHQLTFGPGDKTQPKWSPDGTRLLYVTPGGEDTYGNKLGLDIKIINADGTGIAWVIHSPGDDTDPAWSPDGKQIAFTSTRVNDSRQVFLLNAECLDTPDGCLEREARNISCLPDFCAVEFSPKWAPASLDSLSWLPKNHTLAVAVSINQAPAQIFLRAPAPGEPIDFDRGDRVVGVDHLTWSPDGSLFVFTWYYKRGTNEIYAAPVAERGGRTIRLTESNGNKEPALSPDGRWIAFTSTRDQNPEVYLMTINGAGEENLTNHPGQDMMPDWQP